MVFLPALLRRSVSDLERDLLSLPARLGGLGIFNPVTACVAAYENSRVLSEPLMDLVLRQQSDFDPIALRGEVATLRTGLDGDLERANIAKFDLLFDAAPSTLKVCLKVAREKGASSWVTAVPTHDHETVLNKGDFVDAVYIRYGWTPVNLPTTCVCGKPFDVQHTRSIA